MAGKHAGSCLCGRIRFEVVGHFDRFFLCHCEHCRKDTGSAHAANLFLSSGTLEWVEGRSHVTEYTLPGTRHARSFCSICGSALPVQNAEGGMIVVPAGSLDSAVEVRPAAHIFVSSRAAWDEGLEALPSFASFPS